MHLHVGVLEGIKVFAYVIFFGAIWRIIAGMNSTNAVGQGMSFIF